MKANDVALSVMGMLLVTCTGVKAGNAPSLEACSTSPLSWTCRDMSCLVVNDNGPTLPDRTTDHRLALSAGTPTTAVKVKIDNVPLKYTYY